MTKTILITGSSSGIGYTLSKMLLKKKINVGCNKPYSGFFYNHTLDYHSQENKIKNLSIEIRNDLICDKKGIIKWSNILKESLKFSGINNE